MVKKPENNVEIQDVVSSRKRIIERVVRNSNREVQKQNDEENIKRKGVVAKENHVNLPENLAEKAKDKISNINNMNIDKYQ